MSSTMRFDKWQNTLGAGNVSLESGNFYSPGSVIQFVDNQISSPTETYTTVADGVEYQVVSVSITPKFATSKLVVAASAQVRIVSAYGVNTRIKKDGVLLGNTGYSNSFFYKGDAVNHHLDARAQGSFSAGSTSATTFTYFMVPFAGTGEVVNGRYGMHYIQVWEIAQ